MQRKLHFPVRSTRLEWETSNPPNLWHLKFVSSAPINAKDWGHDFVVLQGTAMINPSCPDEHRSTFNKIPLLKLAYGKREWYDQVLILDTDAMIVDFHCDITRLLPPTHLLAAHRLVLNVARIE